MAFEDDIAAMTLVTQRELGAVGTYAFGADPIVADINVTVDAALQSPDGQPGVTERQFDVTLLTAQVPTPRADAIVTTPLGSFRLKSKLYGDVHLERWRAKKV